MRGYVCEMCVCGGVMRDTCHVLSLPLLLQAEAQCAWLNAEGLVDGVVTDDNDVFLFGGKHVYRNIFDNNK